MKLLRRLSPSWRSLLVGVVILGCARGVFVSSNAVPNSGSIDVQPAAPQLRPGEMITFTATESGAPAQVTWSVTQAEGGSISSDGEYTAPAELGTYHVVAVSTRDPRSRGTATVTVTANPSVTVSISPPTASVTTGGMVRFMAFVTGADDRNVTWSVQEPTGGAINSSGVYTAPGTAGTYHVIATSVADSSKQATATVSVTRDTTPMPGAPSLSISPKMAPVLASQTLQFRATVTGVSDMAVTWSVEEGGAGGTINGSGLYTAPSTAGVFHVVATSNANRMLTDRATITVSGPASSTPGVWQNVTPPGMNLSTGGQNGRDNFGAQDVLADPARPGDFYAFACYSGVWKSTDFGLTWTKVSAAGSPIDRGKPWGEAIDPNPNRPKNTPPTLYGTAGNGPEGLFRSTDGGVTWTNIFTAPAGYNDDVYTIDVNPADSNHLLVTFHNDSNLAESKDGGRTWIGKGAVPGLTISGYIFFITTNIWLAVSQRTDQNGTHRTEDGGRTWTRVSPLEHAHGGSQIYVGANGVVYLPGEGGLARSTDYGKTWTMVERTKQGAVIATGSYIYSAFSFAGQGASDPLLFRSADGITWSKYTTAPAGMTNGPKRWAVAFDGQRYVIVGGFWLAGLWRYVEP